MCNENYSNGPCQKYIAFRHGSFECGRQWKNYHPANACDCSNRRANNSRHACTIRRDPRSCLCLKNDFFQFFIFLPRSEKCTILFEILERVNVCRRKHNSVRAIRPVWCYSFGRRRMRKTFIWMSMWVCLHSSVDVLCALTHTHKKNTWTNIEERPKQ